MDKHSPEPWTERLDNPFGTPFDGYFRIIAADSTHVATVPTSTDHDCKPFGPGEANKRRILACVNLCAGIPTEEIEKFVALRSTIVRIQSSGCKTNSSVLSLMQEITARQILGDRGYKIEDPHE